MRVALLIQYDGSSYHGWQVQADPQTVQGTIESALSQVFKQSIGIIGSGRTDSGVHALGQVAHFDLPQTSIPHDNIWMALNRFLPEDIRIVDSQLVDNEFHSRFKAKLREYRYLIATSQNVLHRSSNWYVRFPLDIDILEQLPQYIMGSHDFSSFCYAGTETENMVCDISKASWENEGGGAFSFQICGDRFLHHMVRMLVGNMIEVARGKWDIAHFKSLLDKPDRKAHSVTAPSRGLALMRVTYPNSLQPLWKTDQQNLASTTGAV